MITLDFKINFTPENSDKIPELHERVAQRIFDLFNSNGGLYIKLGYASSVRSLQTNKNTTPIDRPLVQMQPYFQKRSRLNLPPFSMMRPKSLTLPFGKYSSRN